MHFLVGGAALELLPAAGIGVFASLDVCFQQMPSCRIDLSGKDYVEIELRSDAIRADPHDGFELRQSATRFGQRAIDVDLRRPAPLNDDLLTRGTCIP